MMIRSLTLKIDTFLNKEKTEGLKQSHLTDFFKVVDRLQDIQICCMVGFTLN